MSKHILVIDDDPNVRKSFSLTFEDSAYHVETAKSGEQGVEKAKSTRFDLIFLDLKMPGMNGVEALRELRMMDRDVPIYIVTAFHKEFFDQLQSVSHDGIDFDLLQKPVSPEKLLSITVGILEGSVSIGGCYVSN